MTHDQMLAELASLKAQLLALLAQLQADTSLTNAQKFVAQAKADLDENLSIGTGVDSTVACAISVNKVHQEAFGFPIGGGASTHNMYQALLKSPYFKETTVYAPGCIIISPTGYGTKPQYPNGHVGIVCNYGICANNSANGLWSEKYLTLADWKHQFCDIEGFPYYLFQRI